VNKNAPQYLLSASRGLIGYLTSSLAEYCAIRREHKSAVQNCWQAESRNPRRFEFEGAFRSWLVRVLIDEALAILRESQGVRDTAAADVNVVSVSDSTVAKHFWQKRADTWSNRAFTSE
jgi:hypothetical protein